MHAQKASFHVHAHGGASTIAANLLQPAASHQSLHAIYIRPPVPIFATLPKIPHSSPPDIIIKRRPVQTSGHLYLPQKRLFFCQYFYLDNYFVITPPPSPTTPATSQNFPNRHLLSSNLSPPLLRSHPPLHPLPLPPSSLTNRSSPFFSSSIPSLYIFSLFHTIPSSPPLPPQLL